MNKKMFYSLNTMDGYKYLDENYIEMLYDYYFTGGNYFGYKVDISKEEFINIITVINESLKEIYTEEQVKVALIQFIQLLMGDARDNNKIVNKKYIIKHLNYISLDLFDTPFLKKSKKKIKEIKRRI